MSKFKNQSGVVLSFDDSANILDWLKAMEMLKTYDTKVTFFINAPDEISSQEWKSLEKLVTGGHAIGCHGWRHEYAVDYCNEFGEDAWIEKEVLSGLDFIRRHGFNVTSFAYPYNQNNKKTDDLLKPYFKHARSGITLGQPMCFSAIESIFKKPDSISESFILLAHGIDWLNDISQIKIAVERAADNSEMLFLRGHRIGKSKGAGKDRNYIDIDLLEEAIEFMRNKKLQFYTFDDLE